MVDSLRLELVENIKAIGGPLSSVQPKPVESSGGIGVNRSNFGFLDLFFLRGILDSCVVKFDIAFALGGNVV